MTLFTFRGNLYKPISNFPGNIMVSKHNIMGENNDNMGTNLFCFLRRVKILDQGKQATCSSSQFPTRCLLPLMHYERGQGKVGDKTPILIPLIVATYQLD